ncbi:Z1 domain-containing protein [Pseudomonas sp. 2995-1]|uniref:Z1 domain-containing protein n=1 Tax=Pseudomonas sp. 2995-1 TaxID=1712679 RepID=UPI000C1523A8|nr:Z1 domain-containing protein [Pseudomonas sp. 2995-1]
MNIIEVARNTLSGMASGPKNLGRELNHHSDDYPSTEEIFQEHIKSAASSDLVFNLLNQKLSSWDYESSAEWISNTKKNTVERRIKIYELLKINPTLKAILNEKLPPNLEYEMPIVIARKHKPWYDSTRQTKRSFYRDAYSRYLRENKGWSESQIQNLEESTRLITERLSDPERDEVFTVKGLVVGYVQSGKTANFTGVVARAADAGYRLIVILAGTMNILRAQTQRRIDRELIGKPFITAEDEVSYAPDLASFIDHGVLPSDIGQFDWHRLTNIEGDYQRLKQGIQSLEFRKLDKTLPFNHPDNLHAESVRLLVVKKVPSVLKKVAADLDAIRTRLADIPTLVIDDESDQASVNTKKPTKKEVEDRTETNSAIVSLLQKLPRAQYVGYTATPFANVFIDPNNEENLFPRDFIISLPRPGNYMGVADFHDLERPDKSIAGSNELAFVRNVVGKDNSAENLPQAIDSFILTGAIKLFRQSVQPSLAKSFRHHTMLVHVSNLTSHHTDIEKEINICLEKGGYLIGTALTRLEKLWQTDFAKFCNSDTQPYPTPKNFNEIKPFLGECWSRLKSGPKPVLIVNGEKNDNPDFESDNIWKIIVGGAKLSRGYTIEGLTISYYRRRAGAADALMQMGRWFGFRDGYRDLVRLYIGRKEKTGAKGTIDLFEAFEGVCRDEIAFRSELEKYAYPEDGEPILPTQVPPLVPSHLLRPTAGNKMYNAVIKFKNFSEDWKEPTLAPTKDSDIKANQKQLEILLSNLTTPITESILSITPSNGKSIDFHTKTTTLTATDMIKFLRTYKWEGEDRSVLINEIEFLEKGESNVDKWIFLYVNGPKDSKEYQVAGQRFRSYRRSRTNGTSERFNVYSESPHRILARYLCGLDETKSNNPNTKKLRSPKQGVFIFYPTIDINNTDAKITTGFALQFPHNDIKTQIRFGVNSPKNPDDLTTKKTR